MIFFFLVLSTAFAADDCSNVENFWTKAKLPESLGQGNTEWCFAYAAANIFSLKTKALVDPIPLAQDFHLLENPYADRGDLRFKGVGGYVRDTLNLGFARGLCFATDKKCTRRIPSGGYVRSMEVTDKDKVLFVLDRILAEGEPAILSIDLGFLREKGHFFHALTVVGRERSPEGICEYIALDSNRSSTGWKPSYRRSAEGFLRLGAQDIRENTLRIDYIRGPLRLNGAAISD